MAVQILNDMPDAAVNRGDPEPSLGDWTPRSGARARGVGRPAFVGLTIGVHLVAVLGLLSMRQVVRSEAPPPPLVVDIIEEVRATDERPAMTPPPLAEVTYALVLPDQISFDIEPLNAPQVMNNAVSEAVSHDAPPAMVESVEYVRAPAPVYPRESSRRREYGTVVLRVVVDTAGRPAQIRVERSSGYERLDLAARSAVEKALFRPHEVNGIAQSAQVLIPIEFARRAT